MPVNITFVILKNKLFDKPIMKRNDTKDAIADGYRRILARGSDMMTVSAIIKECGVSRQTFYYHFKGLDDLRAYIINTTVDEMKEQCVPEKDPRENLYTIISTLNSRFELMKIIQNSPNRELHRKLLTKAVAENMMDYAKKSGYNLRRFTLDELETTITMYAYGIVGLFTDAINNDKTIDPDAISDLLYRLYSGELTVIKPS